MLRPGPRLLPVLLALAALSLAVPLLPVLAYVVGAGLLMALGGMVAERVLLQRVRMDIERAPASALSLDEPETITVKLRANAARPICVAVRQHWPKLLGTLSSSSEGECRPGEALVLTFEIRGIARGSLPIPPLDVATSIWGLAERVQALGPETELHVLPNIRAVRRLHGKLNQFVLRGAGNRTSPRLGKGREFDRLREYVRDDDFRDIAWKASARHRKLIVREFRLDRSQDVLVCIDRGHRMAARVGNILKADHAVNATLLLGYICHRMEDRMGALSFAAEVEKGIGQGNGAAHLQQITAFATGLEAGYVHTDYLRMAAHVRHRLKRRALVLIVTSLPEGEARFALIKAVGLLIPRHLPLVMVLTDPPLRAASRFLPADKEELCRTLVAKDVCHEHQLTIRELRRRGALVVEAAPEDIGLEAINAYIDVKRRQLI